MRTGLQNQQKLYVHTVEYLLALKGRKLGAREMARQL